MRVQDYPCPGWEHHGSELVLLGPDGRQRLEVVAQTFTQGCDVEAELAVVGTRHELEFRGDLEGRILVVHTEASADLAMNRNVGLLAIEERRPAAAVVVCPTEDVPTKLVRDPFLRVPVVAVAASVGRVLLGSEGERARLVVHARRFDSRSHNVIAHFGGRPETQGRIVVGAHYDGAAGTPAAFDDGSGTAVLLELCETLAARADRRLAVDLIAFGAEEYGRHLRALGSVEYVRRHTAQTRDARAMIQLDGVGNVGCVPAAHLMGWPDEGERAVLEVFRDFPRYVVDEEPILGSDHVPFLLHGVPVVFFMNDYRAIPIHTSRDNLGVMDPGELEHTAQAALALLTRLSGASG